MPSLAVLLEPTAIPQISVVFILPTATLADVLATMVLSIPKLTLLYTSAITTGILIVPNTLPINKALYIFIILSLSPYILFTFTLIFINLLKIIYINSYSL